MTLFTYSREIPGAHANPLASLRWPPPPDDDDDVNADGNANADVDACADDDDDGRAWDGYDVRRQHFGHAPQPLQPRILHRRPSNDDPGQLPTVRRQSRSHDDPLCKRTVIGYR